MSRAEHIGMYIGQLPARCRLLISENLVSDLLATLEEVREKRDDATRGYLCGQTHHDAEEFAPFFFFAKLVARFCDVTMHQRCMH